MTIAVQGVRSKNNNMFVYCSYWGCWSRILRESTIHSPEPTVEVNLTAVNGRSEHDWASTRQIWIRAHGTSRDKKDQFVGTLPEEVIALMREWMDAPLIERLLHEDFLPEIDWAKYRKLNNGGAAFPLICK